MSFKHPIVVKVRDENNKVIEEIEIFVKKPTSSVISDSDIHKAKIWNKCLSEGILTKMELAKLMEKRGIWDDAMQKSQDKLLIEIADLERELYIGSDDKKKKSISEGKELAIEIRKKRIELRDLITERIAMEENTAESIAENAKFNYIVSECTFYKNGERVFEDLEDYNSRDDEQISFEAASELAKIMFSLDKDFEKNLPENKWLNKFHLIDEDLHIINKDNQKVDINGLRVDDNGNYINDNGDRVDKNGNLLEEDGTYVLGVEYTDDTVPRKRTRKKTVKAES